MPSARSAWSSSGSADWRSGGASGPAGFSTSTLADLAAVRSVIEDGAVHLHHVAYTLDEIKGRIQSGAPEERVKLEAHGRIYDELCERMKVRLGPTDEVTLHFLAADEAVLEIYRV